MDEIKKTNIKEVIKSLSKYGLLIVGVSTSITLSFCLVWGIVLLPLGFFILASNSMYGNINDVANMYVSSANIVEVAGNHIYLPNDIKLDWNQSNEYNVYFKSAVPEEDLAEAEWDAIYFGSRSIFSDNIVKDNTTWTLDDTISTNEELEFSDGTYGDVIIIDNVTYAQISKVVDVQLDTGGVITDCKTIEYNAIFMYDDYYVTYYRALRYLDEAPEEIVAEFDMECEAIVQDMIDEYLLRKPVATV